MKYEQIIHLLSLWQEFEESEKSQDMKRFSIWLSRRTISSVQMKEHVQALQTEREQAVERLLSAKGEELAAQYLADRPQNVPLPINEETREEVLHYYRHLPLNSRISALLTRMNRFASFYTKKAFAGLELTNAQEFGILACVQGLGTPTKTEVAHFNLMEKTTGTEIMKRMLKLGYIEEFEDENDKRSKRVKITPRGNAILETAVQQLWELSEIVVGNLSEAQKHTLATMLEELDDFHSNIYFHESALPLGEIITKNVLKTA